MQAYNVYTMRELCNYFLALDLFATHQLTMVQAAKLANMSLEIFITLLGEVGIDAVDYSADELDAELEDVL